MPTLLAACISASSAASSAVMAAAPSRDPAQGPTRAAVKVWVILKDKGPIPPGSAAARPEGSGGPAPQATAPGRADEDRPLYPPYLESLAAAGLAVEAGLKWQNRVSGRVDPDRLAVLRALPFVAGVEAFPRKAAPTPPPEPGPWEFPGLGKGSALASGSADAPGYGALRTLMDSLGVARVHRWMARRGMRPGEGVRIAVIDADFRLGHRSFDSLFAAGRIRDQWDFVDDRPLAAARDFGDSHGAACLSLIGAVQPDTLVGAAPHAEFLLYRAEDVSQERYVEEDFVAAAIERAVDSGAGVISISLGYRYGFTDGGGDYPYEWMDGRTRPSSLAALGAARRNVLVVASVGNQDGDTPEEIPTLGAPADADSILAVGMVDALRRRCDYSCTGPSADGRIKPDIMSMGPLGGCQVAVARTGARASVVAGAGTSFGAPVIAGIAALLRQARPELSAEEARRAILASGHRARHPDSRSGYGLADAWAALHGPGNLPPPGGLILSLWHRGGRAAFALPWTPGNPARSVIVADARGRRIPVAQRLDGGTLLLEPEGAVETGIYFVRARPGD